MKRVPDVQELKSWVVVLWWEQGVGCWDIPIWWADGLMSNPSQTRLCLGILNENRLILVTSLHAQYILKGVHVRYMCVCIYVYMCVYTPHAVTHIQTHPHSTEHRKLFREGKSVILWKLTRRFEQRKDALLSFQGRIHSFRAKARENVRLGRECSVSAVYFRQAGQELPNVCRNKWWPTAWHWPNRQHTDSRGLEWLKGRPEAQRAPSLRLLFYKMKKCQDKS